MDLGLLSEFLGWCLAINVGLLCFSTISILLMMNSIIKVHQRMFGLEPIALKQSYFNYLANYKIAIIILNLVPFLALKMMGT